MKSSTCLSAQRTMVRCQVRTSATQRATAATIAQWRRQPLVIGGEPLSASFMKHADDQTVLALHTIVHTLLEQSTLQSCQKQSFVHWGVVAASNFFGRPSMSHSFERYQKEGAWGVSPHLIPHHSLHAISGTISQALKSYGPNFGIGGGPNSSADAFLLAAALLADDRLPGLWLVLTGHDTELVPLPGGLPADPPMCQAVVMALMPCAAGPSGLHLSIGQNQADDSLEPSLALLREFQLSALLEEGTLSSELPEGKWRLSSTHWVELETVLPEREVVP